MRVWTSFTNKACKPLRTDGVHMETVGGKQALAWALMKAVHLPRAGCRRRRGGLQASGAQDPANGGCVDPITKAP